MSLGNDDNRDTTDDDPELRMPYRKRRRFHETPPQPLEKWREACYRAYPDLDSHSEADKETIESRFKVQFYIALGLDSSLPRTATSGSIETPKVSPLLQRPPRARIPSRTSPAPATPARPIEPVGSLQPLKLLPNLPLQPHLSPLLPVPPLAPLLPHSSHSSLPPLPLESLPPIVTTNPYLSSFYPPYEKPLITSDPIKRLQDTFVKSTEEPSPKSDRTPYFKEEPILKSAYNNPPTSTVEDDCFIKPLRPVSKPYRDTFLESFKKSSSTSSNETYIRDSFVGSATSSSYNGSAKSSHKKRKRRELLLEPAADPFKRISISQTEREQYRHSRKTARKSSEDRDIKSYYFFEPIEHLSSYRKPYTKIADPFVKKPEPLESFYNPSTTAFSIPKLAQSSSLYVDCPPVYPRIAFIDLEEEISDNNNDVSVSNNNNNNEENDEPIDYSLNHQPDLYP